MADLLDDIRPLLQRLAAAPHWRVAFSGGIDSTVVLHLLHRFCIDAGAPVLAAIHIDHGLSADAGRWAEHCAALCRRWGLAFAVRRVDVERGRSGLEAAARSARWRAFTNTATAGEVLFLGHHRDDQVETVLLRLLRGGGARGLAGMAQFDRRDGYSVCRPLLAVRRERIRAYAVEHGLDWIDDDSNRDTRLSRNYLRHRVIPLLAAHWPDYRERIAATARHNTEARELLDERADEDLAQIGGYDRWGPWLELAGLAALSSRSRARAINAVGRWLIRQGAPLPAPTQWPTLFDCVIDAAPDRRPLLALPGYALRRHRGRLYLVTALPSPSAPAVLEPGADLALPGGARLRRAAGGDMATVRFRRSGERFRRAPGAPARPLNKLLAELAVPPWLRDHVPLVYVDDELIAIADLAVSSRGVEWLGAPAALDWLPPGRVDAPGALSNGT